MCIPTSRKDYIKLNVCTTGLFRGCNILRYNVNFWGWKEKRDIDSL